MNEPVKLLLHLTVILATCGFAWADERPNILWICIEDWGPDLSCYGTPGIETPHVDQLASEGIRYQWAFTTSPVCSTSRSAMMTGFHQNYVRAHLPGLYFARPTHDHGNANPPVVKELLPADMAAPVVPNKEHDRVVPQSFVIETLQ